MPKVTCKHCGYSWNYKGSKNRAECPKCKKWIRMKESVDAKRMPAKPPIQEKPLDGGLLDTLDQAGNTSLNMNKAFVRDSIVHILGDDLALRLAEASQKKRKSSIAIMRDAVKKWLEGGGF